MWDRVGVAVLLTATAVMYLWNITINGMGNQFYAAAAQAGSTNWEDCSSDRWMRTTSSPSTNRLSRSG
jgi:hypothetical protein